MLLLHRLVRVYFICVSSLNTCGGSRRIVALTLALGICSGYLGPIFLLPTFTAEKAAGMSAIVRVHIVFSSAFVSVSAANIHIPVRIDARAAPDRAQHLCCGRAHLHRLRGGQVRARQRALRRYRSLRPHPARCLDVRHDLYWYRTSPIPHSPHPCHLDMPSLTHHT